MFWMQKILNQNHTEVNREKRVMVFMSLKGKYISQMHQNGCFYLEKGEMYTVAILYVFEGNIGKAHKFFYLRPCGVPNAVHAVTESITVISDNT